MVRMVTAVLAAESAMLFVSYKNQKDVRNIFETVYEINPRKSAITISK